MLVELCEDGSACPLCQVEDRPFLSWQQFRGIAGIANLRSEGRQRNRVSKRSRQFRGESRQEVEQLPDAVGLWEFHSPPYQERLQVLLGRLLTVKRDRLSNRFVVSHKPLCCPVVDLGFGDPLPDQQHQGFIRRLHK